jgi:hypothetical protein
MLNRNKKTTLLTLIGIILLTVSTYLVIQGFKTFNTPITFQSEIQKAQAAGEQIKEDFKSLPTSPIKEDGENFQVRDSLENGPTITTKKESEDRITPPEENNLITNFPKDYSKKIEVKLDAQRSFFITDLNGSNFSPRLLTTQEEIQKNPANPIASDQEIQTYQDILQYQGKDKRKSIYYAYQRDTQNEKRKVKNWIVYNSGTGQEKEEYQFENVKLKKNSNGDIEGFFFGEQQVKNEEVKAQVDSDLFERARVALAKDAGADIESSNQKPDFVIPKPFIIDAQKKKTEFSWELDQENSKISVNIDISKKQYPMALDPTVYFNAPTANLGSLTIAGEASSNFGSAMVAGDFNADGKTDLAVGASGYSAYTGRVYIFYNDGTISTTAASADVIITGVANFDYFGDSQMIAGDFNADGKTDLAVGAKGYSSSTGRVYIFNNDGTNNFGTATCTGTPALCSAANADVIITGEAISNYFGNSMAVGDFDFDGKTDLAVGAYGYATSAGRVYIFNSSRLTGGSQILLPLSTISNADVVIGGVATGNQFGRVMTSGNLDADSRVDLAVSAYGTGYAYIFYNDGAYPATSAGADVSIVGVAEVGTAINFAWSMTVGDLNNDGKSDFIVGSNVSANYVGGVYVFYNDGTYPTTSSTADLKIAGNNNYLGDVVAVADFNGDGRTDLIAGDRFKKYIFYNDGSYPESYSSADVVITSASYQQRFGIAVGDFNGDGKIDLASGDAPTTNGVVYISYSDNGFAYITKESNDPNGGYVGNHFGTSLETGDFDGDGTLDLVVGEHWYGNYKGKVHIFYNDGSLPTSPAYADFVIAGQDATAFGFALKTGDFNGDGKTDLAVGGNQYSGSKGGVWIFYNDGSMPRSANTADVFISGENSSDSFGAALAAGDFNADGKTDLAVGAYQYSATAVSAGRVYVFYCDGSIPATAATADAIITGEAANNYFGQYMTVGDFDADGKTDLTVGAYGYLTSTGRAYIFYSPRLTGGSQILLPLSTISNADVVITGEASSYFGKAMEAGDFNADGKTDLVVGGYYYTSRAGRVYIFYNDGSIPTTAATADLSITGVGTNTYFGAYVKTGDLNADGKPELIVGDSCIGAGKIWIFNNDGSIPTTSATADATITGITSGYNYMSVVVTDFNNDGKGDLVLGTDVNSVWIFYTDGSIPTTVATADFEIGAYIKNTNFGVALAAGDFNSDGKTDLAVGSSTFSSNAGRVYFFYGNNSDLVTAGSSIVINGEANSLFGSSLTTGDFNADGKTDLVVGAPGYSTNTGRAYIFNNDGSIPTTAALADVIMTGETTNNYFGSGFGVGDLDFDAKTDLAVGAYGYSANTGRVYIFNSPRLTNGSQVLLPLSTISNADVVITGEAANNYFGFSMTVGNLIGGDTRADLVVSAYNYNNAYGRVYIFKNDGSIPTTAATADLIISGYTTGSYQNSFGYALAVGDMDSDGTMDLIIGSNSQNFGHYDYISIFYNDGSMPTTEATADVSISGNNGSFGTALAVGDFNGDGRTDLASGEYLRCCYSPAGSVTIFYNDGSYPAIKNYADVTIGGDVFGGYFGISLAAGDFNGDGRTDLAAGTLGESSFYYLITKRVGAEGLLRGNFRQRGNTHFR